MTIKCVSLIDIYQKCLERNLLWIYFEPINNRIKQVYIFRMATIIIMIKNCFFFIITCDVHICSSEQLKRTPGNPVSRIYIRHFVDESLCSLRIQYCYRGTYFIDRRSLTQINQRQINRRRAAVRHETNLQSRRKNLAFGLCFLS